MTYNELEKYVGRWIGFTQTDARSRCVGTVNRGKLFKTRYNSHDILVCCFNSLNNPKSAEGFSWSGRPKESNRSWTMFTSTELTPAFKDFKTVVTIGEFGYD